MKRNELSITQKFTAAFLFLLILHWVLFVIYPGGIQRALFFSEGRDFMADFFNPLRYVAEGNPYFGFIGKTGAAGAPGERIYPPLAYLILYPFSQTENYSSMTLQECWSNPGSMIAAIFFTVFSCFVFYFALNELCAKYKVNKIIIIPLMLSGLFMRSVERGNLIVLSIACTITFIAFYDSQDPFKRNLAVIMLAVSAVLKVYPCLFGIFYLRRKMYKEFCYAVILSACLGLLPFLFFKNGFANITRLLANAAENSRAYGSYERYIEPVFNINHYFFHILKLVGLQEHSILKYIPIAAGAIQKILAVLALIAAFFVDDEYLALVLCILGIIFLPANSGSYCGLYLFPAVVILFSYYGKLEHSAFLAYAAFYLFCLSPLQYGVRYKNEAINSIVAIACVSFVFMMINLFIAAKRFK